MHGYARASVGLEEREMKNSPEECRDVLHLCQSCQCAQLYFSMRTGHGRASQWMERSTLTGWKEMKPCIFPAFGVTACHCNRYTCRTPSQQTWYLLTGKEIQTGMLVTIREGALIRKNPWCEGVRGE